MRGDKERAADEERMISTVLERIRSFGTCGKAALFTGPFSSLHELIFIENFLKHVHTYKKYINVGKMCTAEEHFASLVRTFVPLDTRQMRAMQQPDTYFRVERGLLWEKEGYGFMTNSISNHLKLTQRIISPHIQMKAIFFHIRLISSYISSSSKVSLSSHLLLHRARLCSIKIMLRHAPYGTYDEQRDSQGINVRIWGSL